MHERPSDVNIGDFGKRRFPISVLYVSPHIDFHGADRSLFQNLNYLNENGLVKPFVILPAEGLLSRNLRSAGIPFRVVPFKSSAGGGKAKNPVKTLVKRVYNGVMAAFASSSLARESFDLVHTNDMITDFGIKLARILRVPHVQHGRALLQEQCGIYFDRGEIKELRYIDKHSASVIFNSKTVLERYKAFFPQPKVHVIYSPAFEKKLLPKKSYDIRERKIRFIFAGRIEPAKDPMVALGAVEELVNRNLRNFDFSFFGSANPHYKEYLRRFSENVTRLPRDTVFHHEFDPNLSEHLSEYDIGIFCSPIEGIPRVISEFLLNGMPVIGTNSPGTLELIKDGFSGLIFEPRNAVDLANKMEFFIQDRTKIPEIGFNAQNSLDSDFSLETTSEQLYELYRQCIK
ncbi:MAG: glycosyltransferase family 4 protein [Nitrososphaerota archaeon]|nr:glycosyltransferase family 4 protein [Nitrososphaerota archaeon]